MSVLLAAGQEIEIFISFGGFPCKILVNGEHLFDFVHEKHESFISCFVLNYRCCALPFEL
jgi:hypothetical protein